MVTLPLPTDEPVAVTEQLPDTNVHDEDENVTAPVPGIPCVKVTVPVGLEPVTVALQELVEPTATLEGTQLTAVEVDTLIPTVNRAEAKSEATLPVAVTL